MMLVDESGSPINGAEGAAVGQGQRIPQKERFVPIGSNSQKVLRRYLFRYRSRHDDPQNEYVFLSTTGKPLTENSLKLMFARLAQRSGVNRLHAHLCRHTFAINYLLNGGDIFSLKEMLGHGKPLSTFH